MTCTYFGQTDQGRVRKNNEDAFVVQPIFDERHLLSVVIDGVGGYEGGEVAADITARTIADYLLSHRDGKPLEQLKQAVTEANNAIISAKQQQTRLAEMGCVCTASLIDLDKRLLYVAHIGDTRLYRIVGSNITKLTHDHSLVGYREEIGELTEEEAMHHPNRNVIERYLGEENHQVGDPDFIDAAIFPIAPGETLLYCSDGLYDMLTSAEILTALSGKPGVPYVATLLQHCQSATTRLIAAANAKGGHDNVTVILVSFQAEASDLAEPTAAPDSDTPLPSVPSPGPARDGISTDSTSPAPSAQTPPAPSFLSAAWLPCLFAGLLLGFFLGSRNMSSSVRTYTDSIAALRTLIDSLQADTIATDTLAADTLQTDSIMPDTLRPISQNKPQAHVKTE